jgi:hypothetical protein
MGNMTALSDGLLMAWEARWLILVAAAIGTIVVAVVYIGVTEFCYHFISRPKTKSEPLPSVWDAANEVTLTEDVVNVVTPTKEDVVAIEAMFGDEEDSIWEEKTFPVRKARGVETTVTTAIGDTIFVGKQIAKRGRPKGSKNRVKAAA